MRFLEQFAKLDSMLAPNILLMSMLNLKILYKT